MAETDPASTARVLLRVCRGEAAASRELFPIVYEELRGLARGLLRRERPGHTLQTTALIHEAYLRLVDRSLAGVDSRTHFVAIAARCMRQILVDHARVRGAQKRGGDRERNPLDDAVAAFEQDGTDLVALHEALERLGAADERKARVVELRFFGGLTIEEAASVLGVSPKTIEADWHLARAWLRRELDGGTGEANASAGPGHGPRRSG